jgi:hypothetical protein
MELRWNIYRDCDTLRLRKIVIELFESDTLIHRTRMFYTWCFPRFFAVRLRWRKAWMLKVAKQMLAAEKLGE